MSRRKPATANGPVETKVKAATGAAAATGLVLWILGEYVFTAGVPDAVSAVVLIALPAIVTFLAGYNARHTPRIDPPPPPDPAVPGTGSVG